MRGAPAGATVSIRLEWERDPSFAPEDGDYIVTTGGSAYMISSVRQSRVNERMFALRCLKLESAEDIPFEARMIEMYWKPRRRGRPMR